MWIINAEVPLLNSPKIKFNILVSSLLVYLCFIPIKNSSTIELYITSSFSWNLTCCIFFLYYLRFLLPSLSTKLFILLISAKIAIGCIYADFSRYKIMQSSMSYILFNVSFIISSRALEIAFPSIVHTSPKNSCTAF